MVRVRWLAARWPVSLRMIAIRMKEQLFTADSLDGFVIERVRDTAIEGQYIEKLSYDEVIIDPFGQKTIYKRVGYRQIDFCFYSEFPNIELHNSHRSIKGFINKIIELCDFSVTIEPISINLLDWVSHFEVEHKSQVMIDSLQISKVQVMPTIQATILLKGHQDVRPALERLALQRDCEYEKIQMSVPIDNRIVRVRLSSSAYAQIPEDYWNEFLPALRKGLAAERSRLTSW